MQNLFSKKTTPLAIVKKYSNPFLALQKELDHAMQDFYGLDIFDKLKIHPKMDIVEDKDNFKVELEMPGMGEEDIHVSVTGGVLIIKGEKSTSHKDSDKNYVTREITYGHYERHIGLPDTVDASKTTASFKKGMLWVSIPKKVGTIQHTRDIPVEKK